VEGPSAGGIVRYVRIRVLRSGPQATPICVVPIPDKGKVSKAACGAEKIDVPPGAPRLVVLVPIGYVLAMLNPGQLQFCIQG